MEFLMDLILDNPLVVLSGIGLYFKTELLKFAINLSGGLLLGLIAVGAVFIIVKVIMPAMSWMMRELNNN